MLHHQLNRLLLENLGSTYNVEKQYEPILQHVSHDYNRLEGKFLKCYRLLKKLRKQYHQKDLSLRNEMNLKENNLNTLLQIIHQVNPSEVAENELDINNAINYLKQIIDDKNRIEQELLEAKLLAEKALQARSEFLSMMSHEIRNPLNAIVGTSFLLLKNNENEQQAQHLNMLKYSAENLMRLVNDILDYSKIEAGKIDFEKTEFSLTELLQNVKSLNLQKAEANNDSIQLAIDEKLPNFFIGDSLRIGQIITNLVSNAVKFTQNGNITIKANLVSKTNGEAKIQFAVSDTGIGIPKEKHHLVFEKFTQANDFTSRKYGGTGLGLSISSKLLELMNAQFSLESEEGKGSTFSFELCLPFINTCQKETPTKENETYDLKGIKVLLTEDNEFNSIVATTFLEDWNIQVDTAFNGKEAVEKALQNDYHLILMDLQMPIMNGYDAAKEILKIKPHLPIVALTASALFSIVDLAFDCGMIAYVTKPFEPEQLYKTIQQRHLKPQTV